MIEQFDKEMTLDPLASIKSNGILGFSVGETTEEVFSRIKTLGLLTEEEINRGKQSVAAGIERVELGDLVIGQSMFKDISSIHLNINRIGLKTITVNIEYQPNITPQQQLEQLVELVINNTGQMPKHRLNDLFVWDLANSKISLSYGINFDVGNVICLEFDKLSGLT